MKLKYKLVSVVLLSSTLPLAALGAVSIVLMHRMALDSAHQRIIANLKISRSVYQSTEDRLKFSTRDQNRRIAALLNDDQLDLLRNEFAKVVSEKKFDFFVVTDAFGKVLVSLPDPGMEGYNFSRDYFVRRALRFETHVATDIVDEQTAGRFGIAAKTALPGVASGRALVLRACTPVISPNEIIIGTLTAGYVLNNNNSVVIDRISEGIEFVSSIFMEDIRVSSNVPVPQGEQVLGTRIEADIYEALLANPRKPLVRTVYIGDRGYLAGYTALVDYRRQPIGILAIGIPLTHIFAMRDRFISLFSLAVLLSGGLAFLLGFLRGHSIVRSVTKFRAGIEAFARNDLDTRIQVDSGDEIEELAAFFNQTMQRLKETRRELEQASLNASHLRDKVMESSVQLEEAHKQLLEYERLAAMGRMATVINHELRNIFTEIQGSLMYLKEEIRENYPQGIAHIAEIEKGLNYATDVLGSVLRLSFPKKLSLSDVDLKVLVEDLFALPNIRDLTAKHHVVASIDIEKGLPTIPADGMQLREVVSILVVNAVQAMSPHGGGTLTVSARRENGWAALRVSDTGPGMPASVLENLFTPFFTTKSRGLGLGLSISREIVKAHKGTIEVHSQPNQGATFLIKLPIGNPA